MSRQSNSYDPIEDTQETKGHNAKKSVPKFASFRPKGHSKTQARPGAFTTVDSASISKDKPPDRSATCNDLRESEDHHHQGRDERPEKKGRRQYASNKPPEGVSGAEEDTVETFIIDRVGDPSNLTFGALDRHTTPSYLRLGAGNVVGLSRDQTIDRSVSGEKVLILSDRKHSLLKKGERPSLWNTSPNLERELRIKPQAKQGPDFDINLDFVTLTAAQRIKKGRDNDGFSLSSSSSSGDDKNHYRSTEGKPRSNHKPTDQNLMYDDVLSSSDDQAGRRSSTVNIPSQKARTELLRCVEADPSNCSAWLDLIRSQDDIFGVGRSSKRMSLTSAERRSNADVKLNMYEKALQKVSVLEGRENLILGMMEEAAQVCTTEKLKSKWKSVLMNNPDSLRLWTQYLNFRQTNFTSFNYEEIQTVYADCLDLLRSALHRGTETTANKEQIYENQIYIVLRMTSFMRESGFSELALAAWQALLEFIFFKPTHLHGQEHEQGGSLYQNRLSCFERFWDSEVPRIGEDNSQGWASFSQKQNDAPEPRTEERHLMEDVPDIWKSWIASERRYSLLARQPARTTDDGEENDPYRVILFSDIQHFLADCPSESSQQTLLDAFLAFCHFPTPLTGRSNSKLRLWLRDGYLRNETLYPPGRVHPVWKVQTGQQQTHLPNDLHGPEYPNESGSESNALSFPVLDYQLSLDSLFASLGSWFLPYQAWQIEYSNDLGPLHTIWVLQVIKTLVLAGVGGDSLAELLLALELRFSPKTVKKTSRTILKRQPSNLRLYNAYALVEYRLGNPKIGENVIVTSINMSKNTNECSRRQDPLLLWRTWIWETMTTGDAQAALGRLLAYGDDQVQPLAPETDQPEDQRAKPAVILRAEKALTATRDRLLFSNMHARAVLAVELLIFLNYLKSALSISIAISTYESNLPLLSPFPPALEYLHQCFAHLLYHHATHTRHFKPSSLRSLLAHSIFHFPANTIFLSLYAWNESRFRIDDRVRSIINTVLLAPPSSQNPQQEESVVTHYFAIFTELHRAITFGSNTSTIRSTFERAVASESGAHCAGVWKLYFLFEQSRGKPQMVKAVYWRGVRACPWVKELYLLAFDYLRDTMGDDELRGVYELLEEKGLRVHVGLDDFLERRLQRV